MQVPIDINSFLIQAIQAAFYAGQKVLNIYNSKHIPFQLKQDLSPLTFADIASNQIIIEYLEPLGLPFISEESEKTSYYLRKEWSYFWLIDPLDGTKEFLHHNGEFTINIALIHKNKAIIGVIFIPVYNELYFASSLLGSYKASNITRFSQIESLPTVLANSIKLPIYTISDRYIIVLSRSHSDKKTDLYIQSFPFSGLSIEKLYKGSSLKFCMVAEGSAHLYPRIGKTMEWDTAAGTAIAEFANASTYQLNTKNPLLYNKKKFENPNFVTKRNN
ncbi:MAG: 3'(2'),5'-bisphosphate nucleotidase CysQ [Lentimicrobiaceae bacterium]|nr:3'(2'),5'-bisphosphate nucleotidase CysQ [Lentimicrobiaceae bacterium]